MATEKVINLLGFSACTMPHCDCGARVVLGLTHEGARRVVELLTENGYELTQLTRPADRSTPTAEPIIDRAADQLNEYVTEL